MPFIYKFYVTKQNTYDLKKRKGKFRSLSHQLHAKLETLVEATLPTLGPIVHVYLTAVGSINTVQGTIATILTLPPKELLAPFTDAHAIPCTGGCVIAHGTFGDAFHDTPIDTPANTTHKYTRVQRRCILFQHPTRTRVLLGAIGRHSCLCIILNVLISGVCLEHSVDRFFV